MILTRCTLFVANNDGYLKRDFTIKTNGVKMTTDIVAKPLNIDLHQVY